MSLARPVALLASLALLVPTALEAQRPVFLEVGTRVRIVGRSHPAKTMQGHVRRLSGDTLVIYDPVADGEWGVPLEWIASLRRPRVIRLTNPVMLLGMAAGARIFWALGEADWTPCVPAEEICLFHAPREVHAAGAALVGAVVGMAVGGGLTILVRGYWEEVPVSALRVRLVPLHDGRVGFGVAFRP